MSNNETFLEYKRRVIDIKSASFCGAKWYNATIWLGSGQTTSCHHNPSHTVLLEDLEKNPKALHNTEQKKIERAMMQRGERPSGCEYCWKIEDIGPESISDRVYQNRRCSEEDLEYAVQADPNEDINLQTLEIAFDRTCQFACSYCNPAFSTSWVRDIHTNGPYTNLTSDGRNHFTHKHDFSQLYNIQQENPYVEAFFKWWETDLHKTLKELRITGGEPLMSGYTWKLFDWFKENKGQSQTKLAINSNLGVDRDVLVRLLDSTEGTELSVYTSNESIGRHAMYIRDGLDWDQWCGNVEFLLSSKKVSKVILMCTINALCLTTLIEFLQMIISFRQKYGKDTISFSLSMLRFPSFQSSLVLPIDYREEAAKKLENFASTNQSLMQAYEFRNVISLIDYLREVDSPHAGAMNIDILQRDFKNFYEQYDQRRGKDFRYTFPELAEWYDTL